MAARQQGNNGNREQSHVIERGRENAGAIERQKRVVRPEQRTSERKIEKQKKPLQRSRVAAIVSSQKKQVTRGDGDKARTRELRKTEVEAGSRRTAVQEKPVERRKREGALREQREERQEEIHRYQRKITRNEDTAIKESVNKNRKLAENEEREETERQISRNKNSSQGKNVVSGAKCKQAKAWQGFGLSGTEQSTFQIDEQGNNHIY